MNGVDFDWTDAGAAEDHADRLEELSMQVSKAGRYNESATLHVSSNCIRYLSAKAELLEKENDAAEKENEALREALNKIIKHSECLQKMPPVQGDTQREIFSEGFKVGWAEAAEMAAAHDKEGK